MIVRDQGFHVALSASDFLVRAFQGEPRLRVIKRARAPVRDGVTSRTFLLLFARSHELAAVDILMTVVTQRRRLGEIGGGTGPCVEGSRNHSRSGYGGRFSHHWSMTAHARDRLVRAFKLEASGAVVERS